MIDTFGGVDVGMALDWDSEIEKDSPEYVVLAEGEYEFVVASFERARFNKEDSPIDGCWQAKLKLQISVPEGIATINHNLYLHSRCEGMLCAFFNCIGQKKHGEKIKMDWGKVPGSKGRAKISIRTYTDKGGNERHSNEVKRFLEPEAPTPPTGKTFKPGSF